MQIIQQDVTHFALTGRVEEADVNASLAEFTHNSFPLQLDCSGLESANSITVAWLIAWRRHMGGEVQLFGASESLQRLIHLHNLAELIPLCKTP